MSHDPKMNVEAKGLFKQFPHLTNINVERMLGNCWTQKKQSCTETVQMVPTLRPQKNQHFREIWLRGTKN